ncbi:methyltransferase [Fusarium circinatum]|uniref:Methyltransferase n=1 Tax=Fusarium circinatum TaxID=48490 RepID=A0A8H5UFS3_FUSCI|nr:methyltransferase [Fusarium circinatum]
MSSVKTSMHFLQRSPKYETEKPYSLRFPPPRDLAHSNILREKHDIQVHSMRDVAGLTLEEAGLQLTTFLSSLAYEDFADGTKRIKTFLPELASHIKDLLGAAFALPIDSVRRRHITFPVSTGQEYEHEKPTNMAHIDFTEGDVERMLRIKFGNRAEEVLGHEWKVVKYGTVSTLRHTTDPSVDYSAWKPLIGPSNDWPLAVCDARTVDYTKDTMPCDIVYSQWVTENQQIHYNPEHKWYYLPDQTTDEVLLFKSAESSAKKAQAVPHGSFHNPKARKDERPRESIDCRFIVFYAPLDKCPPVVGDIYAQKESMMSEEFGMIHESLRTQASNNAQSLVLVSGVGTTSCPSWFIVNDPSWQQCLKQLGTTVTIHAYDHEIPLDDHFEWQCLLDEGGKLLDTLHYFHEAQKAGRRAARMIRSKKIVVVDKQLCRIGVEAEELLGASMSHDELVRMERQKSPPAVRLQTWLTEWIEASHAYVGSKLSYGMANPILSCDKGKANFVPPKARPVKATTAVAF